MEKGRRGREMGPPESDSGPSAQPWGEEMGTELPRCLKRDIQGPCLPLQAHPPAFPGTVPQNDWKIPPKARLILACVPLGTQYFA